MKASAKKGMMVSDYLAWCESRTDTDRFELVDSEPIAQAPERARHAETKFAVAVALQSSIKQAKLNCHMLPDGMTVAVDEQTAYEPDALIYCGEKLADDAVLVPNPVVIVEVLSPGTAQVDLGAKLIGYVMLASVRHYLIVDCARNAIVHHARSEGEEIKTQIVREGTLHLTPPGLKLPLKQIFATS